MKLLYAISPALLFLSVLILILKWPLPKDTPKRRLNRSLKALRKAGFKCQVMNGKRL